ncbi:MAG: metallopeptidase family protein [Acidimicrobiia bacterium]
MDPDEFERLVDESLEDLPDWVLERLDNVAVVVEETPREGMEPDLLGIYEGVSLLDRGIDYSGVLPDRITIFREPHLDLGLSRDMLRHEIRRTVLHEIAHHLGIEDDRLHEIGYD